MTARRGYPGVDRFRVAAALLVVCIHTAPLAQLGDTADLALRTLARLAVPFFFTATGFFVLGDLMRPGPRPAGPSDGLRRFWRKTALLYAAASALYLPVTLYAGNFPRKNILCALARDLLLDGTFYHLWYLPAALLGTALVYGLLRAFPARPGAAAGVCLALYAVGLLGDSWHGLAAGAPALRAFYDALFLHMDHTRNGLFFAPVFLFLGAALCARPRPRARVCAAGLAASLALLFAEAFLLRAFSLPRHDSMYLALLPCAYFLFALLTASRGASSAFLREYAMLLYLAHPMVIVAVRGAAKLLHAQQWLVEDSLFHFLAVAAVSCAVCALPARWAARRREYGAPPSAVPAEQTRAWAEIDLDAIAYNAAALRRRLPPGCRLMAVVKADAYGHGAPAVAGRLWQAGVRAFAVATLEEGRALRRCGVGGEILILGYTDAARVPELRRWRLSQTVAELAHGRALAAAAGRRPLPVHIAVDTGMHRLGVDARDSAAVAELLRLPGLRADGLFTHLAAADSAAPEDAAFTRAQLTAFAALAQRLREAGLALPPLHAQASGGILSAPGLPLDYARPGIALYGALGGPNEAACRTAALRPALALRARVVCVRRLRAGECAGYGRAFCAPRDTLLAVVSIGYADGWPRAMGEQRACVLLRGRRVPIVGRVCMDQLLIDATDAGAAAGDVVTLIGADGAQRISAEETACAAGTIANELLCRIGARVPRVYRQHD